MTQYESAFDETARLRQLVTELQAQLAGQVKRVAELTERLEQAESEYAKEQVENEEWRRTAAEAQAHAAKLQNSLDASKLICGLDRCHNYAELKAHAARLAAVCEQLISYRDRAGAINFQLEKADDYHRLLRAALDATPADSYGLRPCSECGHPMDAHQPMCLVMVGDGVGCECSGEPAAPLASAPGRLWTAMETFVHTFNGPGYIGISIARYDELCKAEASLARLRALEAFVTAFNAWEDSAEHFDGPLWIATLEKRDAIEAAKGATRWRSCG
jgi:hypothetical protein